MNFLKRQLQRRHAAVQTHPNGKNVGLPTETFRIAHGLLEGMIDMGELPEGAQVVLVGGVQINMPRPLPNFFCPMHFSTRSADQAPESLLDWLRPEAPPPASPTAQMGRTASLSALKSAASGSWRRAGKLPAEGPLRPALAPARATRKVTLPDVP